MHYEPKSEEAAGVVGIEKAPSQAEIDENISGMTTENKRLLRRIDLW
jgi:hypothetical protein